MMQIRSMTYVKGSALPAAMSRLIDTGNTNITIPTTGVAVRLHTGRYATTAKKLIKIL